MRNTVLLVEDNPGDVELTKLAFESAGVVCRLQTAESGEKALEYLSAAAEKDSNDIPDLVLLDLNLPGMDGHSVLARMKSDERFKNIPVLVLSSSAAADDIQRSYDLSANDYVQKPTNMADFVEIAKSINTSWLGTAKPA